MIIIRLILFFSGDCSLFDCSAENRVFKYSNLFVSEFINQLKDEFDLHDYEIELLSGQMGVLDNDKFVDLDHSSEVIIITKGQLEVGLRLSLYHPSRSFFYEVLYQIQPPQALGQVNGNSFRSMTE